MHEKKSEQKKSLRKKDVFARIILDKHFSSNMENKVSYYISI